MLQLSFSLDQFLSQYWQKKPVVIRGGFADFVDPISPDELAGLTMEEEIDSRFVSNLDGQWSAEHGPFDEEKLTQLGDSHWQLIVQAANHWHPGAAQLVEPFKAMPQWLFDDVMVCYSAPGGGVGPHIDQYDVFIIQGQGKRRWRVGALDEGQYQEQCRTDALRQIEGFDAVIDDVLEPGDIIYIPPGYPHEGQTLEASMSYSVGFRSPKEQELLSNFADYVLAHDMGDAHLHNPELQARQAHGAIGQTDLAQLDTMLNAALRSPETVRHFMGCMLSQSRHQLDVVEPEEPYLEEQIQSNLYAGDALYKVSGLRALYHENEPLTAFINGEVFHVTDDQAPLLQHLCNEDSVTLDDLESHQSLETFQLLTQLVNKGFWYFPEY